MSGSAVESMILALISSKEGSTRDCTLEEVHTMTNKARNCIEGSLAHARITILHQLNDFRERSRLYDRGSDIV